MTAPTSDRTDQRPDHQRKDRDHRSYKHYASHSRAP
jgi:hypothetical protein